MISKNYLQFLTPDVSHSIHFSKEPRMRQTIRIHPHSSLIKLLYALRCVREKALLASKRPIAFHLQRSSVEKIPFNAYRNIHWKLRIICYFHCVRYLVHFNVYAQAGWRMPNWMKNEIWQQLWNIEVKSRRSWKHQFWWHIISRGWNFIWIRRAYNYSSWFKNIISLAWEQHRTTFFLSCVCWELLMGPLTSNWENHNVCCLKPNHY